MRSCLRTTDGRKMILPNKIWVSQVVLFTMYTLDNKGLDCRKIITLRFNWLNRKSSVYEKIQCKRHIMKLNKQQWQIDQNIFKQTTKCNVNPQHCIFSGNREIISFDFCLLHYPRFLNMPYAAVLSHPQSS